MQKLSLNIKKVVIIALMSLCMLSFFALGVFATMKIVNVGVKSDINPNMYFSVEIQKNGTVELNWKKVFDNFHKDVETSTAVFNIDVLELNTNDAIFGNMFSTFTSNDKLYIRITNYNEDKTLNAKVIDSATATITSFKTNDTVLLDGVKYIDEYESSPPSASFKTFYCKINANFTHDVKIPIKFSLTNFPPRADFQTILLDLHETELYVEGIYKNQSFSVDSSLDFNCLLMPMSGFALPALITIYRGVEILPSSSYTYNQNNGTLKIPSGYITDEIIIRCYSV